MKQRPKYLNLFRIRLPLTGFVSILHRISGLYLFLFIPVALFLFESALKSPQGFREFKLNFPCKILVFFAAWAVLHHFFAGIRHLLLDVHAGVSLREARMSARLVLIVSLLLTFLVWIKLW